MVPNMLTREPTETTTDLKIGEWIVWKPLTMFCGVDRVTRMKKHRKSELNITKYSKSIRKTNESLIILIFFGTRKKQEYQDDSSFSSWYPFKTDVLSVCLSAGLSVYGTSLVRTMDHPDAPLGS